MWQTNERAYWLTVLVCHPDGKKSTIPWTYQAHRNKVSLYFDNGLAAVVQLQYCPTEEMIADMC